MINDYVLNSVKKELLNIIEEEYKLGNNLEDIIDKIDFKELCKNSIAKLSNESVEFFKNTMFERVSQQRNKNNDFLKELERNYGEAFIAFEAMYILVLEAAEQYGDFVAKLDKKITSPKEALYIVLREIHGRVCQQYAEISCLLRNGFADGALSRWRSMYELSIIAYFIIENGNDTAKSFIDSAYSNDRYDWAKKASCFKNHYRHITFSDIQRNCSFNTDKWMSIYNIANKLVHASPQGTFDRLGRGNNDRSIILVGRSDYGLKLPLEAASISLNIVTELFLSIFPNSISTLSISYINSWVDVIREYYENNIN